MKKLIIGLVLGIISLVGVQSSDAVKNIVGIQATCDSTLSGCNPIPLAVTLLCGPGSCPKLSAPSFTSSTRFWGTGGLLGNQCLTSNDGGATWGTCATQPLSSGAQEQYAGASDGSVIAIGQNGVTCNIYKSTDNGTTWVNKYTNGGNIGCGGGVAGGSRLKCISTGSCVFGFDNTATGVPGFLTSTDNGNSWSLTGAGVASNGPMSLVWDGTIGLEGPTSTLRAMSYAGSWSQGAAGYAGCSSSGAMIYNNIPYSLCKDTGVNANYQFRTADGALFKTIVLPNGVTSTGGATGVLGWSVGTNIMYIVAGANTSPIAVGVWLSRDGGTTFNQLYQSSTGTNNMVAGDIYFANSCIYFSTGSGSQIFAKIC